MATHSTRDNPPVGPVKFSDEGTGPLRPAQPAAGVSRRPGWGAAFDTLLLALILVGIFFRFSWVNWNQDADLHPDEYGLTNTLTHLSVPRSFAEYINTRLSPLSPYQKYDLQGNPSDPGPDNRMRWGQWPITIIRVTAEWSGNSGYGDMRLWGRSLSALADTLGLLLIFLIGARIYGRRVGLLAAALGALAVMQIQQSHFMTSDNFALLFSTAAMYCAVRASEPLARRTFFGIDWLWYALFGIAFGMAVASRINLALLAIEIVIAALVALAREGRLRAVSSAHATGLFARLALAGVLSLAVFRLTQPMSFRAPTGDTTLLTVHFNSDWSESMAVASNESKGIGGGPPGEQWTNRPAIVFPWLNMVLWGLGLPLGLAAWAGLAVALWRVIRHGEWAAHLLPLSWAGGYFLFMGTRFVKSIRYFLPIYPFMALFAAWLLLWLWRASRARADGSRAGSPESRRARWARAGAVAGMALVIGGTLAYAWAFTGIYRADNTRITATRWIYQNIPGPVNLVLATDQGAYHEPLAMPFGTIVGGTPIVIQFASHVTGNVESLSLPHVVPSTPGGGAAALTVVLSASPDGVPALASATLPVPSASEDARGNGLEASFGPAVLNAGATYFLLLSAAPGQSVVISRVAVANESWDEGLPLRIDGRDAFGGLYDGLTVENRWIDDAHKVEMFLQVLEQADYLFLPSQRGLWTPTRLPRSYPLTVEYYRALFDGRLGFERVALFTSPIRLGPLYISDVAGRVAWGHPPDLPVYNDSLLAAEEAFSVYDHAPVWIFRKSADFSLERARAVLEAVDLTTVVPPDPRNPGPNAGTQLLLPPDRLAEQRAGGTWSDMFSRESLVNRYPLVGIIVWWLWVVITGWAFLPIARMGLRGLPDLGYSLAKIGGWLLVSWAAWILGSLRVPFVRITIGALWLALVAIGIVLVLRDRERWAAEVRDHWRTWLVMEGVFLALFLFDLLIRYGNGDLWHPAFGGEKPMDFSYLNAVLRSTSFPPFDPWFAGGYINYYYFGFVILAIPIKLLGVIPSFAYNLSLPTLFALVGSAGFGLAWSLAVHLRREGRPNLSPWLAGAASALGLVVLGNLGEVRLVWRAMLSASTLSLARGQLFGLTNLVHGLWGGWRLLTGMASMPYSTGDWYWLASRAIPVPLDAARIPIEAEPITEFPFFTFLYGDPHAHMIAMPLTLLAMAAAIALVLRPRTVARWREFLPVMFVGSLAAGALRPTNTWDFPAQLGLIVLAIGYANWQVWRETGVPGSGGRVALRALAQMALAVVLAFVLFQPYSQWYLQGYTAVEAWHGSKTPLDSYLIVHGLFLFVLVSFMVWQTREWMARTPMERLGGGRPGILALALLGGVLVVAAALILYLSGFQALSLALPLLLWAGLLALRKDQNAAARVILVLTAVALALTVVVELVVLKGDISRMNTVFKFYLQVWLLFGVAAGPAAAWAIDALNSEGPRLRAAWNTTLVLLVLGAGYYTYRAGLAKVQDRMALDAPRTLDGMTYMAYATYADRGQDFTLREDYDAIRWMQENVQGSPVIVEANTVEYHWGSRFTIYTGLPGVVGWNWHQRQQRGVVSPIWVEDRVREVGEFYETPNLEQAASFLARYDVAYIIVGKLERAYYSVEGLDKFELMTRRGMLKPVYSEGATVIYEVTRAS